MRVRLWWLFLVLVLSSCFKGERADLVVFNAQIASQDGGVYQAMAIREGKIIELGPEREILNRFRSKNEVNGAQKSFYPSFIDANASILQDVRRANYFDAGAMETVYELLMHLEKRQEKVNTETLVAYNYSLTNWQQAHQELLEERFPNTPVVIYNSGFNEFVANPLFRSFVGVDDGDTLVVQDVELRSLKKLPSLTLEKQKEVFRTAVNERKMMGYQALVFTVENMEEVKLLTAFDAPKAIDLPMFVYLTSDVLQAIDDLEVVDFLTVLGLHITLKDIIETNVEKLLTVAVENQLLVRMPDALLKEESIQSYLDTVLSSVQDHRWQVVLTTIDAKIMERIDELNLIPVLTPSITSVDPAFLNQLTARMYVVGNSHHVSKHTPFDLSASLVRTLTTQNGEGYTFSSSDVLKGLTLYGAYGIQQEKQIGGLEKGKKANFVQLIEPFGNHSPNRPNYVVAYFLMD